MCSACTGDYENPDVMTEADENFEQTIRSAAASFYHTNLVNQIHERMGEGDALHLVLRDTYYREKFRMAARKL
jgi:hypothetical protein